MLLIMADIIDQASEYRSGFSSEDKAGFFFQRLIDCQSSNIGEEPVFLPDERVAFAREFELVLHSPNKHFSIS